MTTSTSSKPRPRRWRRILKRVIITLVVLAVVLVFGVFPYLIAVLVTNAGTRPMDRTLTETPATFGAEFKDVEFETSDHVRISGWLLPSKEKRVTIVFSHGLFRFPPGVAEARRRPLEARVWGAPLRLSQSW